MTLPTAPPRKRLPWKYHILETLCSGMLSILAFLSVVFWGSCAELLGWAGWLRYGVLGGVAGVLVGFLAATLLTWLLSPKR